MRFFECLRARGFAPALLAVLLACAALTAACSDPEKLKAEHVTRGEAFLKERKFHEAALEFRNAIQIDEALAPAHWGLARAYEGLERYNESFDEMSRALKLDPSNREARYKIGSYLLIGSQRGGKITNPELLEEAGSHAEELLKQDANYVPAHILLANVWAARNGPGDRAEALKKINHAISLDPSRVESYVSLAGFYRLVDDLGKAEETFKRAIQLNDRASLAYAEYGKFLAQQRRADEAEAQFRKAVEVDPANPDVHWILASFYLVNNRLDRAEEAYKALAAIDPSRPDGRTKLADFYASTGRLDDALNVYRESLQLFPEYARAHYRVGELLLQKGDRSGAAAKADEILKKNARDPEALLLRARLRLEQGQTKEAVGDLGAILEQEPRSQLALYFMSEAQFRDGQLEQARSFAGDLERFHPNFLPAKLMQLQVNLSGGDPETVRRQASELLDRLRETPPSAQQTPQLLSELKVRTLTARGMANMRQRGMAKSAGESASLLAAARADMEAARDVWPNSPSSYTNLAGVAVVEGKYDEAFQLYERALALDATNFQALDGLVQLYGATNRFQEARARLDALTAAHPDAAHLHYLRATAYAQGTTQSLPPDVQATEAGFRRAIELDPDFVAAYQKLAELYFNMNQPERSVAEYQKVAERRPNDAVTFSKIGMVEYSRRNLDAAAENYRRALSINPGEEVAANNLAMLYAEYEKGNLDEAVRLAQEVVRRRPEQPGYADTLGWVYYKKGLYAPAVEQLQKAVSLSAAAGGDNSVYRLHLGLALTGKGDRAAARRELQAAQRLAQSEAAGPLRRPRAPVEDIQRALESL